ncbi:MAG: hypothetical protein HY928_15335 [Elusimicrobia bacterium]|nr:hypothetical protein [Elusimicrobiota bacterium]
MSVAAPAYSACFTAYGARVGVDGEAGPVEDLGRDFAGFPAGAAAGADIRLTLRLAAFPLTVGPRRRSWRGCRWSDAGAVRTLEYPDRSGAVWDYSQEEGALWSPRRETLHELAYLFVHSRLGARLDGRGLHRAHALGLAWRGAGALVFLPEGGGKTTLALHLACRREFALLSDDIPLVSASGTVLHAFPQRLSLRGAAPFPVPAGAVRPFPRRLHGLKSLLDLGAFPGGLARCAPARWVFVGLRSPGAPSIRPCPSGRVLPAVLEGLVAGVGTPQVLELMAPSSLAQAAALARTAASRLAASARLLSRARTALFKTGDDPAAAARALADFLDARR